MLYLETFFTVYVYMLPRFPGINMFMNTFILVKELYSKMFCTFTFLTSTCISTLYSKKRMANCWK